VIRNSLWFYPLAALAVVLSLSGPLWASEADIKIPNLDAAQFNLLGLSIPASTLLLVGTVLVLVTFGFSLYMFVQIGRLPAHASMLGVADIIYQTCKTYLFQQGKFLLLLFLFIGAAMTYYQLGFAHTDPATGQPHTQEHQINTLLYVLFFAIIGMLGSYLVAWYGIRVNTLANARTAFASLGGRPWDVVNIPLRAGMSIGLFLISLELLIMIVILLALPRHLIGPCFLGFAIGESLAASALRIAGGIFTKIADIGSDLMKIAFNIKEDDPRNPGVIADCTGDNAGDSVGPTADGFETYGVTGVALIAFITLALTSQNSGPKYEEFQAILIVWLFAMRILMGFMSGVSYYVNQSISERRFGSAKEFDFETPLTTLIFISSALCISTSYLLSWLLLGNLTLEEVAYPHLWWQLASIISCGTLAAVLIPEFTKVFTSSKSVHVKEIVSASREGGASLTILSGLVAGNFSAFWKGMLIAGLMALSYFIAINSSLTSLMAVTLPNGTVLQGGPIFALGLVAFGFLCMGPVNIAVDSYGPVTDNAQSVFELARTEHLPGIKEEIERDFKFTPNFEEGKHYLEANDSAGNTFKATAKPVLIGTAVVGATTMIFSIILMLGRDGLLSLSLTDAPILFGFICGGAVIFWFSGASMQAVTTGAYRAVEYIRQNLNLDKAEADINDSKTVVRICTEYAQTGMWNIFVALVALTLAFAFFNPNFFVAYLISIAVFGLFQAIYMANAGGAWDNAKKLVEVDLKEKGTPLHAATVVGDTVGDPFKDTTSVALNPIIKFSTLFGLLAVEIAVEMGKQAEKAKTIDYAPWIGVGLLLIGLVFVWRSFYAMLIPSRPTTPSKTTKA
jgi:K(+)-stimulated pyrophosphate-energized sodium pump